MLDGLWLAVLGVLAASSLIIAKKPDAKEIIGKIAPYQGWIGVASALRGIWTLIDCLSGAGLLGVRPLLWLLWLAEALLLITLGLLLGVGIFKSFIKNPTANAKLDAVIARLAPYQGKMALGAIGLGLVWIILRVV